MRTIVLEGTIDARQSALWDAFVAGHPQGSVFQTSRYYGLFLHSAAYRPVAFLLYSDQEEIVGVLVSIIQYYLPAPFKALSARSVIFGGPLVNDNNNEFCKTILSAYDNYISSNAIYSQFRNLSDMSLSRVVFREQKYIYEDHLNIMIDLTKTEEQLWKEMHPKRRNEVKKAEKEGLFFQCIETQDDFEKSYAILKSNYTRIRLPFYYKDVFTACFHQLLKEGYARFFGVYYKEELIGTMYTLCFNGRIYDWFAGSRPEFYHKYPNDFLPWELFKWAKRNGFTVFDWGGAGKPGVSYGVRDYKEKFGGEYIHYGRYEKVHKPLLFKLAKIAFPIWQKVKR